MALEGDEWKTSRVPRRDISAEEALDLIERLDFLYDVMSKEYAKILDDLRHPWRSSK